MELSARDRRVLAEMEEFYAVEDPHLAAVMTQSRYVRIAFRQAMLGLSLVGLGIGLMTLSLATQTILLGATAFSSLTAGATILTPPTPWTPLRWAQNLRLAHHRPRTKHPRTTIPPD
ncbi:MAG: DUF3040 domain-containing protein [Acidobacteria bacterium]|nr:DUF3040 domain-containing protein [Acidobacteriota bacterium]